MKRFAVTGIIIMTLLMFSGIALAAGSTVWVSSANALLKAGQSASSQTIESLPVGAELSIVSTDLKWYRVKSRSGREGWIYRGKISTVKPETAAAGQKTDGGLLGNVPGSSITASSADSSRSIRGLSPEAQEYAQQTGKSQQYRDALDSVLAVKPGENEIEQFLKEGKIGEYAE